MLAAQPLQGRAGPNTYSPRNWQEFIWNNKPIIAFSCFLLILFFIASSIVLSLIPLYLPTKDVSAVSSNDDSANLELYYGTDLVNGSLLNVTDLKELSAQLSNELHLSRVSINSAKFASRSTTNNKKKRQATGINNAQCLHNDYTTGDWLILSISIKFTDECHSANCRNAFIIRIQEIISNVHYNFNLAIKFTNGLTINVKLSFCSYTQLTTAPTTSQTSHSAITSTTSSRLTYTFTSRSTSVTPTTTGTTTTTITTTATTTTTTITTTTTATATTTTTVTATTTTTNTVTTTTTITATTTTTNTVTATTTNTVITTTTITTTTTATTAITTTTATTTTTFTTTTTTTTTTTSATASTTTTTTTQLTLQSVITQCQSSISTSSTSGTNQVGTQQIASQATKVKMPSTPNVIGDRVLLKNAYLLEFAPSYGHQDHFETIAKSLKASHGISKAAIKPRHIIRSSLFSGASFSLTVNHPPEAIEMIEGIVAINPVYIIPAPRPLSNYMSANVSYDTATDSLNSHNLTGVTQVHQQLQNFGAGVRVAVIDTGVYYLHPALGGCFGPGCRVAFGYDLVGDAFGSPNGAVVPDNDPLDNCSFKSHGTHVSGIIAANTTGITQNVFTPFLPFIGVAPQVTLGAYRVFGCNGDTTTDTVGAAVYRAYNDIADIITISIGGSDAYSELSDSIAIQKVISQGVYVTVSMGNSGQGGLQTGTDPGDAPGAIAVASVDSVGIAQHIELSPVTGGTPSSFTSLGPTGDLLFKPQISGIGGYVYSTVSLYYTSLNNLTSAYDIFSGTSMACPYTAGILALFLASIGNPPPITVYGNATNGICRPTFSVVTSILQSNAVPVNIYNTPLLATVVQQGAGLVNAYQALTATTLLSQSQLALNDSVRTATSYTFDVTNIGTNTATYSISHSGAALATGVTLTDDQLLATPLFSGDYAIVNINPTTCQLASGQSCQVTLQFQAPTGANSALFPIYSGFIYVNNTINSQSVHLSYAGMVGNYYNAQILVRNTSSGIITGIADANSNYATNQQLSTLNATQGLQIIFVLAWSTRYLQVEAVTSGDTSQPNTGSNSSYGLLYHSSFFHYSNLARNVGPGGIQSYSAGSESTWVGQVYSGNGSTPLSAGQYRIRFSALKHFGNISNPNDFEVYRTPVFNLVF